jgi:alkylation response protein AidB-like acyl-CoA dehydrogenase
MQGLGSGPISLFGSDALKAKYLPDVCAGRRIAAFALSEPAAGSDVGALATTATADGTDHVRINGIKTWISNGSIADHYIVFARTGEAPGVKGLSAFVVDANTPGLTTVERIEVIAPHPLATLRFHDCRIPVTQRLGAGGDGFKVAMVTLDVFRATVGAAATGDRQASAARGRRSCRHAHAVRPVAWRFADDTGRSRRKRRRSRCRSAAGLSRCVEQRRWRRTHHTRIVDRQNVRN